MEEEYELGELVGTGSSAQVYWAERLRDKSVVAIKVVDKLQHAQLRTQSKSLAQSEELQELVIQQSLNHPNVLKVLDVFQDARNVFIVLEPCANGSLQALVKGKRAIPEIEAKYYVKQLIAGVDYLHRAHIIHRDLKLSNLLLTESRVLKIADFGLATNVTQNIIPSTICGTPNFIAPEVLLGKSYSYAADLWSIGCIVFTLLTGSPPFQGDNVSETLRNISAQTSSLVFPSYVSPMAQDFVQSILSMEPSDRLPCHALLHHPWLQQNPARRKTKKSKPVPPRRPQKPLSFHAVIDDSSSPTPSVQDEDDEIDDTDIAKLQTMLDKINQDPRPQKVSKGDDEAMHIEEPRPLLPQFPDSIEFRVEYHTILDLPPDEIVANLLCTWTPQTFTIQGRQDELVVYTIADNRISGKVHDDLSFDEDITTLSCTHPRLITWVRLAQICLSLHLSSPTTQLFRLPDTTIEALQRGEDMERQLRSQQMAPHRRSVNHVRSAELFGIGCGECLDDGTLRIAFVDGSELKLDACASSVEFRHFDEPFAKYPLGGQAAIPSSISRKLKYVSLFVQAMKKKPM